jgi:HAD superfamily hydrolase (TIGR01509 family)
MIDHVIFDLADTVIVGMHGVEHRIGRLFDRPPEQVWTELHVGKYHHPLFRGEISEKAYWEQVMTAGRYPATMNGTTTQEILARTMRENFTPIPGMFPLLHQLRDKHLALLSDNPAEWAAYYEETYPQLAELFPNRFYSYQLRRRKREAGTFEAVLKALGADGSRTLFVDDNPKNTAAAREAGVAYTHDFVDAPTLRKGLSDHGLLR